MTRRAELKQKARGSLKGNYGVVVGVMLLSSLVLGVCSGILQLVCSVVGTFSTAGSIALSGAAGLGSQVSIAVVTGSVPSIVCSLLTSIIYSGLTYILMVGGIRVYLKLCAGEKAEIGDLKPEKDDSDTQSAVNFAIDRGAKNITIFGATGNRIDHLLANFGLLVLGRERDADITLIDQWNYMKLVESGTVLKKKEQFGKYVSFFSLEGDMPGLTLVGFKYPLDHYHLRVSDSGLTVSNEIKAEEAVVSFDGKYLLMLMTRD